MFSSALHASQPKQILPAAKFELFCVVNSLANQAVKQLNLSLVIIYAD